MSVVFEFVLWSSPYVCGVALTASALMLSFVAVDRIKGRRKP